MHALPVGENDLMMLLLLYQYFHFTADAKDELVPVPASSSDRGASYNQGVRKPGNGIVYNTKVKL
jgi:hypothetical protein